MDRTRSPVEDAGRWVRSIPPLGCAPGGETRRAGLPPPPLGETTPLVDAYSIVSGGPPCRPRGRRALGCYRRLAGCSNGPVITGNPGCSLLKLITSLMWLWSWLSTTGMTPLPFSHPPTRRTTAPRWSRSLDTSLTPAHAIRNRTHQFPGRAAQRDMPDGGWRRAMRGERESEKQGTQLSHQARRGATRRWKLRRYGERPVCRRRWRTGAWGPAD